jgi:hypothetical protein
LPSLLKSPVPTIVQTGGTLPTPAQLKRRSGDVVHERRAGSSPSIGNVPAIWSVVGTGDFNGDGYSDLLWQDTSGNISIWFMNGSTISSSGGVGNAPPTVWSVVTTGDYNGDGKSDLLWRDTSGNTVLWFMNGLSVTSTAYLGNTATNWTVQSANAE